eukprot:g7913.t1
MGPPLISHKGIPKNDKSSDYTPNTSNIATDIFKSWLLGLELHCLQCDQSYGHFLRSVVLCENIILCFGCVIRGMSSAFLVVSCNLGAGPNESATEISPSSLLWRQISARI